MYCKKGPRRPKDLDHFRRESRTSRSPLQGLRLGRERRCGAKVVSLTLEDAHTKSHRWLTPHRKNLYSDEDHLRPASYLFLPDRREKFEDFNYILLLLQASSTRLLPPSAGGSLKTKSVQNLMFDPGDSTGRLRACPFLRVLRALLCGEVLGLGAGWYPKVQRFWRMDEPEVILQKRDKQIVYTVRVAVDRCFSEVKLVWKGHTVNNGLRLSEQWGERMSGNDMERRTLGGDCYLELTGPAIF